jgi:hypothetical protein
LSKTGKGFQSWLIGNVFTNPVLRTLLTNKSKPLLGLGGVLLIVITTVITLSSPRFASDTPLIKQPVILLVSLMIFSGIIYLVISRFSINLIASKGVLILIT